MRTRHIFILACIALLSSGCAQKIYYNAAYRTDAEAQNAFIYDQMRCRAYANGMTPMPEIVVNNHPSYQYQGTITGPNLTQYNYQGTMEPVPNISDQMASISTNFLAVAAQITRARAEANCLEHLGWSTDKSIVERRIAEADAQAEQAAQFNQQLGADQKEKSRDQNVVTDQIESVLKAKFPAELKELDCDCNNLFQDMLKMVPVMLNSDPNANRSGIAHMATLAYIFREKVASYGNQDKKSYDRNAIGDLCMVRGIHLGMEKYGESSVQEASTLARKELSKVVDKRTVDELVNSMLDQ